MFSRGSVILDGHFIEWVSGGHYVYNPTLKRFFLFHLIFPFLLCGFRILHLFYLHFLSSNNPLRNWTNNKIPFFPFIFQKDFFGFILILCLYLLQTHFGISSFSHPDNALEVCGLLIASAPASSKGWIVWMSLQRLWAPNQYPSRAAEAMIIKGLASRW